MALLIGCATPGYQVSIAANGIASAQQEQLLSVLEGKAKSSTGFAVISERRDGGGHTPGLITSSYAKVLSDRWRDHITIIICLFSSERRVRVDIENSVRGMELPVKAEIDTLGDAFIAQLSATVGRENVSVVRRPTRVPLIF